MQVFLIYYSILIMNIVQKITSLGALTLGLVVLSGCTWENTDTSKNVALAECLTVKWATMYWTNRCSHCQNQKDLFGYEAFTKINFVDCDKNKNTCWLEWVQWYPTWKFSDWSKLEGTQNFDALAAKAWCNIDEATVVADQLEGDVPATITTGTDTQIFPDTQQNTTGSIVTGN